MVLCQIGLLYSDTFGNAPDFTNEEQIPWQAWTDSKMGLQGWTFVLGATYKYCEDLPTFTVCKNSSHGNINTISITVFGFLCLRQPRPVSISMPCFGKLMNVVNAKWQNLQMYHNWSSGVHHRLYNRSGMRTKVYTYNRAGSSHASTLQAVLFIKVGSGAAKLLFQ